MPFAIPPDQDSSSFLPSFNFYVSFGGLEAIGADSGLSGGFSEVSGLEATMEPKSIKEGGRNYGAVQRAGIVSFSTVVLKRGVVTSRHLWRWWSLFSGADDKPNGGWAATSRCDVTIVMLDPGGVPAVGWRLKNAMPVKFRAGDLNARGAEVAIEELHLVHEGFSMAAVA
jgi:phage tail-like protein